MGSEKKNTMACMSYVCCFYYFVWQSGHVPQAQCNTWVWHFENHTQKENKLLFQPFDLVVGNIIVFRLMLCMRSISYMQQSIRQLDVACLTKYLSVNHKPNILAHMLNSSRSTPSCSPSSTISLKSLFANVDGAWGKRLD